jgi:hypothetical protein
MKANATQQASCASTCVSASSAQLEGLYERTNKTAAQFLMPSFHMRERRVLGRSPRTTTTPFGPSILPQEPKQDPRPLLLPPW